ncbi:transposase [Streptomyces erythrochromogenes]|uniref:transposase n=1 Tax=Streptomyces erythrochromogenes TaxID=285574 RepID=UPI00369C0DA4
MPGSHQAQWLDALHRHHAAVEDRVRTNKAMGLHNLPSKSFTTNQGWMPAANLAADLDTWLRLLALHDQDRLADAEPDTMRFRLYHLPARLAAHARRRHLRLAPGSRLRPGMAAPDRLDRRHLTSRPRPHEDQEKEPRTTPGPWNPAQPQRHAKTQTANSGDKRGEVIKQCSTDHP